MVMICVHSFHRDDKQKIIDILSKNNFLLLEIKDKYMDEKEIPYIILKYNEIESTNTYNLRKFLINIRNDANITFFFKEYS